MKLCPYCGHQNIEGMDECDRCGHSITDAYSLVPATEVERALLQDQLDVLHPKRPIVVDGNMPVRSVLCTLVDQGIGCVLVSVNGELAGIFSERDALCKLNVDAKELGSLPVSKFMTANPETLQEDATVAFAVHRMDLGSFRHIPVMDGDGKLSGIISVRDILRYLTEKMTKETSA